MFLPPLAMSPTAMVLISPLVLIDQQVSVARLPIIHHILAYNIRTKC